MNPWGLRRNMVLRRAVLLLILNTVITTSQRSLYLSGDVQVCDITSPDTIIVDSIWQPMGCAILSTWPTMVVGFVDSRNQVIRKTNLANGNTTLVAGSGNKSLVDSEEGNMASFWMPYSISTPPMDPAPYAIIADYGNRCIRRIDLVSKYRVSSVICGGLITSPSDTAVLNNGDIYIADPISHTILMYTKDTGNLQIMAGLPGNSGYTDGDALSIAKFNQPLSVAMHSFTGVLYIADWLNDAIRSLSGEGVVSTLIRGNGFQDGIFSMALIRGPKTVRMVGAQILAVADSDNGAIRLLDLVHQNTSTLFGNGTRAHVHGSSNVAKGSAIWGISGTLDSNHIVFTEADSNSIRQAAIRGVNGTCIPPVEAIATPPPTTTPAPEIPLQCGDIPPPSILDTKTYLFTTGDSGFLSIDGRSVVSYTGLPPSSTATKTVLSLPHVDIPHPTMSIAPRGMGMVSPMDIKIFVKTPYVYMDTCR